MSWMLKGARFATSRKGQWVGFPAQRASLAPRLSKRTVWNENSSKGTSAESVPPFHLFLGAFGTVSLVAYLAQTDVEASRGGLEGDESQRTVQTVKKSGVKPTFWPNDLSALELAERTDTFERSLAPISRCDFNQISSNVPIEDYADALVTTSAGGSPRAFWGVYDGHAGSRMARHLSQVLLPTISKAISGLKNDEQIQQAISKSFVDVDNEAISVAPTLLAERVRQNKPALDVESDWPSTEQTEALSAIELGYAGSCALVAAMMPEVNKLHLAWVGDCRAIMGTWDEGLGKWQVEALTRDHNGCNEDEKARIQKEHPGEDIDKLIIKNRLLGFAITRAFGDGPVKWPADTIRSLWKTYSPVRPRTIRDAYLTPPYFTAQPEVRTIDLSSSPKSKSAAPTRFIIMATDGIWDRLTNVEAVGLVAEWAKGVKGDRSKDSVRAVVEPEKNPKPEYSDKGAVYQQDTDFVFRDRNAATHLIRNALGSNDEQAEALLKIAYPASRHFRDDMTVNVVFIGGDGKINYGI